MVWEGSNRLQELPSDWHKIRYRIKRRDGFRCTEPGCTNKTNLEVDHIVRGDDHSDSNLRTLCGYHHGLKSSQEGIRERIRRKRLTKRPREQHPGLRKAR